MLACSLSVTSRAGACERIEGSYGATLHVRRYRCSPGPLQPKQKKLSPVYDMHHNFYFFCFHFCKTAKLKMQWGLRSTSLTHQGF